MRREISLSFISRLIESSRQELCWGVLSPLFKNKNYKVTKVNIYSYYDEMTSLQKSYLFYYVSL